ncbi:MAG TPA: ribulose-phosphate 3-epimerase [Clostridiales bacterium]|nr:MAG: ribulose-phosphate 3-epimerase [Clostridiales bacterium GWD2_32_19]HCC06735.1 ribulose-phosphate 3-epimerase [Clostridiales bacterium]
MKRLLPSILTADFLNLTSDIQIMKDSGIDIIHIDVMDGVFVPNITFGHKIIEDIKKHFDIKCDVHLMITQPEKHIDNFINAGADVITVHIEASENIDSIIEKVRQAGVKIGISLNPDTDVQLLKRYIDKVDMFLVMSVFPGYGGQRFIKETLDKIDTLVKWREESGLYFDIEIDGGIKKDNINEVIKHGANMIVVGSALYEGGVFTLEGWGDVN